MGKYHKLEDYGLIGNLESCALVGIDGAIDWLCLPFVDSPSVFAAVLDSEKGGHFRICPTGKFGSRQAYIHETNVLETTFDAGSGSAILTDFMPVQPNATGDRHRVVFRKIACTRGKMSLDVEFKPGFDYGRAETQWKEEKGGVLAGWKNGKLFLQSPMEMHISGGSARCSLEVEQGNTFWFVLQHGRKRKRGVDECERALNRTILFWMKWLHSSIISRPALKAPWYDLVTRSALTLKLLTNPKTGAVIAAPTTSLPEAIGGIRNWDYRYSWIRDASFTIQAFEQLGYTEEARGYFKWLRDVSFANAKERGTANIKIAYTFEGKDVPPEEVLENLSGYRESRPVRIGNAAFGQDQLDIFGEIISTFFMVRKNERDLIPQYWGFIKAIVNHVCECWEKKDAGIWELRVAGRQLTHSKLMCWVGVDRALKMAEEFGLDAPVEKWERTRAAIRRAILEKGFSGKLNSFVQAFDYEVLDSTGLLIPIMGFLPADDPRVLGTIDAVSRHLSEEGLLRRYEGDDGLPGREGVFVICSFWLVQALVLAGDTKRAEKEFLRILKYKSPLGLFSEEVDAHSCLQSGNYPQAFSHIGLINAALYLGAGQRREKPAPELIGSEKAEQ